MTRTLLTIVLVIAVASCSARVEYETLKPPHSPDAININTAAVDELEKLPSIGPRTAEAIVEHRSAHGAFRRVEHIMLIRGVSERRFNELRHLIKVE